ncbi:hypothetical protein ACHAXT_000006 [Thalassiosira profunda]
MMYLALALLIRAPTGRASPAPDHLPETAALPAPLARSLGEVGGRHLQDTGTIETAAASDDPKDFGYPHVHSTSVTSVSWSNALVDQAYSLYTWDDGVVTLGQCAAKCEEDGAPTGAWRADQGQCFCIQKEVEYLCWEPCVRGNVINFATQPITWLSYCHRSVCEDEWYAQDQAKWYGCDEDEFDEEACEEELAELAEELADWVETSTTTSTTTAEAGEVEPGVSSTEPTEPADDGDQGPLSRYGYKHSLKSSSIGWLSWQPALEDRSFSLHGDSEGVATLEDCARTCNEEGAPAGKWNTRSGFCFCLQKEVLDLCWEPCVYDEFVDFSVDFIEWLTYCERSVCSDRYPWYNWMEFCGDLDFDEGTCDARLREIHGDETARPTAGFGFEPSASPADPTAAAPSLAPIATVAAPSPAPIANTATAATTSTAGSTPATGGGLTVSRPAISSPVNPPPTASPVAVGPENVPPSDPAPPDGAVASGVGSLVAFVVAGVWAVALF